MAETKLMRADEIAHGFNGVGERGYWKAHVAGTRVNPEINFLSRASMVQVTYRVAHSDFVLTFAKTNAAFGDFLASAWRSMHQILTALKAAGLPFAAPLEETAVLRIEYDPARKDAVIHMAALGDDWPDAEPLPFKVPVRKNAESGEIPLDASERADTLGPSDISANAPHAQDFNT